MQTAVMWISAIALAVALVFLVMTEDHPRGMGLPSSSTRQQ